MGQEQTIEKPRIFHVDEPEGWVEKEEPKGSFFDDKPMITDPRNGAVVNFSHYREGFWKAFHRHTCSHGIYVIDGEMQADDTVYGPGWFVWDPAGYQGGHGAAPGRDCHFLFISNIPFDIEFLDESKRPEHQSLQLSTFNAFDENGWVKKEDPEGGAFFVKPMIDDPVTGMKISYVRYPKGYRRPDFRMDCTHGVYVIRGTLSSDGEPYRPGTLIWYPEGYVCRQAAPEGEDVFLLSVTTAACTAVYRKQGSFQ